MGVQKDFVRILNSIGLDNECADVEIHTDFRSVMFAMEGEDGLDYFINVCFLNDGDVFVYMAIKFEGDLNRIELYKQLNELNKDYTALSFVLDEQEEDCFLELRASIPNPEDAGYIMDSVFEIQEIAEEGFNQVLKA